MKLEFTSEMFTLLNGQSTDAERSAKEANAILVKIKESWKAEMLKDAVVVYGGKFKGRGPNLSEGWGFDESSIQTITTHKALLIDIQPIVKEPCKHQPPNQYAESVVFGYGLKGFPMNTKFISLPVKCVHCGVELVAEWKAKS